MGNLVSKCAQNARKVWRVCAKKHAEEEAILSACDGEPQDKCQENYFDQSLAAVDWSSPVSARRLDNRSDTPIDPSIPGNSLTLLEPQERSKDYQALTCAGDGEDKPAHSFVDEESQTDFPVGDQGCCFLSKDYIVKTYSIHNATPSPVTQIKFPPMSQLVTLTQCSSVSSNISPLTSLEKRQEDVLKRLQQLQASLSNLGKKYNVSAAGKPSAQSATISATTSSVTTSAPSTRSKAGQSSQDLLHFQDNRSSACDLVISVDPSSIPLSLVVLCGNLGGHSRVLKSTFVHSSITNDIPDKLRSLLTSNGIKRGDCDLAVNLVWKRVTDGPHLVVDPVRQSTIQGEANVARYLARRLGMFTDETDIVTATLIDEILDLAQLQLLEGNSKEKSAAVRTLNSALGKKDWLVGAEPSLADIVCWSALYQTNQTSSPPANVKKWLNLCNQHRVFRAAVDLIG